MSTRVLLEGLMIGESARWHDGRLWLANWGTGQVLAVDDSGAVEVMAELDPAVLPISIDWLPDGRLLIVAGSQRRLLRQEPDGRLVDHADLGDLPGGLNEIIVDHQGVIYLNGGNEFDPESGRASGFIASVAPDGSVRTLADKIAFPNGMAITSDDRTLIIAESFAARLTGFDIAADGSLINRRTWAEVAADGISIDADDGIWTPSFGGAAPDFTAEFIRVLDGGRVTDRIPADHFGFACALGGAEGRTLYMLTADWHLDDAFDSNLSRLTSGPGTGRVLTAEVDVSRPPSRAG